jgi:glutathione S-transferase
LSRHRTLWAATEVEPDALKILRHMQIYPEAERDAAVALCATEALKPLLAILDKALRRGGGYLVGHRFTVADLNVFEVVRYAAPASNLFAGVPNVRSWFDAIGQRPAFKAMWARREAEPKGRLTNAAAAAGLKASQAPPVTRPASHG